jgi:hypothetical protein
VVLPILLTGLGFFLSPPARAHDASTSCRCEVAFFLGVHEPIGESDLWETNDEIYSQDAQDFGDLIGRASFASRINAHLDIVIGAEYYEGRDEARYRDYVFSNGDPIEHDSRLREMPLEVSFRFLPIARIAGGEGEGTGRVRPAAPFLGAGVGGLAWEYSEEGQFLDLTDPDVPILYNDEIEERGITASYHVLAGIEIQFSREAALQLEGRYRWAEDDLGSDFPDSERIDLSGAALMIGFAARF